MEWVTCRADRSSDRIVRDPSGDFRRRLATWIWWRAVGLEPRDWGADPSVRTTETWRGTGTLDLIEAHLEAGRDGRDRGIPVWVLAYPWLRGRSRPSICRKTIPGFRRTPARRPAWRSLSALASPCS